ncbi:MAG: DUF2339 domain-containing protein [Verrucomicrobia bacterium]|nr:DUF2339 domain-containing protein [Verrucomicrobiota bacterium]
MELFILILIAIVVVFVWMFFAVLELQRRVRWLEDRFGRVAAPTSTLPAEPPRLFPTEAVPSAESAIGAPGEGFRGAIPATPRETITVLPPVLQPIRSNTAATDSAVGSEGLRVSPAAIETQPALANAATTSPAAASGTPTSRPAASDWPHRLVETDRQRPPLNWEQFMGVKLFAWVGGLALFLAVAFFVKYSFDHGWISPGLRVIVGFLTGLGLLVGGVRLHRRPEYTVTAHALSGTGVVVLYAASFAAHGFYGLIGAIPAFALMSVVTVTAFLLAVRLPALVVAVLGLVGGFLTPLLLSSGEDHPLALFGYIALLDAGLVAVALKRRWQFLVGLAAIGTVLMQLGWAARFFSSEKAFIALAIFAAFNALFLATFLVAKRADCVSDWLTLPGVALPLVTFAFAFSLATASAVGDRPGVLLLFLLAADLPLLVIALKADARYRMSHVVAGAAAFLILAAWTGGRLTMELLNWALGAYLLFAALHTVFPILRARLSGDGSGLWLGHVFPALALVLVMIPLLRDFSVPWLIWPVVLLVNGLAIGLAVLTGAVVGVLAMVVLTAGVVATWLLFATIPPAVPEFFLVVGGFAVFFFIVGLGLGGKVLAKLEVAASGPGGGDLPPWLRPSGDQRQVMAQVPASSAILPFLLLMLAVVRLPPANPTPIFGLALLLVVLLLILTRRLDLDVLAPVGLACVLALQYVWLGARFTNEAAAITVAWNVAFIAIFTVFPFVFRGALANRVLPWVTSALAGPLHFFLVYRAVKLAWPSEAMGLIPALFALPSAGALAMVARSWSAESANRLRLLAWFGGATLFFVTLIFPTQFDRQWLTLGWALEGAALLWLFHRVPHPGLRLVGIALLGVAFVRLAVNPAVFEYQARSELRILNWYLYTYGIVIACLLAGARLLAPPRDRVRGVKVPQSSTAVPACWAFSCSTSRSRTGSRPAATSPLSSMPVLGRT